MFSPAKDKISGDWGFTLTEDYTFQHRWLIPAGFWFDGASIPRWAWSALGFSSGSPQMLVAALEHDFAYYMHPYSRSVADKRFRDGLKACGVSLAQRYACYLSVRAAGGFFWANRHEDEQRLREFAYVWRERDDWPYLQSLYAPLAVL